MELLTKLGIDWSLLIAQIANFLILMGVLGFLLYKPLLGVLDRRRQMIKKSVEDAKRVELKLQDIERFQQEKLKRLDEQCGEILARTKNEAEAVKQDLIDLAQREADRIIERGRKTIEQERDQALADIKGAAASVILRATEKIVRREMKQDDERRVLGELEGELSHISA